MTEARENSSVVRVVVLSADAPVRAAPGSVPAGAQVVAVQSAYEAAAELIAAPTLALVVDLRLMNPRHLRLLQIARERDVELLAVGGVPAGLTPEDLSGIRLVARADLKAALERLIAFRSIAIAAGRSDELAADGARAPAASAVEPTAGASASLRASEVGRRAVAEVELLAAGRAAAPPPAVSAVERPAGEGRYVPQEPPARVGAPPAPATDPAESPAASAAERPAARPRRASTPAAASPQGETQRARERSASSPAPAAAPPEAPAGEPGPAPRSILTKEELAALLEDKP